MAYTVANENALYAALDGLEKAASAMAAATRANVDSSGLWIGSYATLSANLDTAKATALGLLNNLDSTLTS